MWRYRRQIRLLGRPETIKINELDRESMRGTSTAVPIALEPDELGDELGAISSQQIANQLPQGVSGRRIIGPQLIEELKPRGARLA